ncbi:MAG: hypothetical protein CME63_16175 [Halobacteriovoraceae bacterium]|nr:hypothetical protein [Halobacteriovoraceae bacterium]|tara:strand:- start:72019 stop:72504 length:486 start_codon:yes stop_codon:yes gene_type:complete
MKSISKYDLVRNKGQQSNNEGKMNKIITLIALGILTLSIHAQDYSGELFNQRMTERYPERQIQTFTNRDSLDLPTQVQELRIEAYQDLLAFAQSYNLFQLGWDYELDSRTYEVKDRVDQVIAYNFSIVLYKEGKARTRRFYQASRRIDGYFFVERIANYDL